MASTTQSPTRVGSPQTNESHFSIASKRYRESTHLIPTPALDEKNRPKRYDPVYFWLPVVVGTPLLMLSLGVALEIGIELSSRNGVSTQFLLSFFPGLFVIPVGYMWRVLDWMLRWYQPYVTMAKGNATAEESVLLDYIALGSTRAIFRALKYNHRVIFWSSLLATSTYIFQPLAGSIFQIQTTGQTSTTTAQSIRSLGLVPDVLELNAFAAAAGFVQAAVFNSLPDPPFIHLGWSTADFPTYTGLNGSMTVNTTGIRTNANCSNPVSDPDDCQRPRASPRLPWTAARKASPLTLLFLTCNMVLLPAPCGASTSLNITFQPVVFWFYQKESDGTQEARTVFCNPTMELFYVNAAADLDSGALTTVTIVSNFTESNNITDAPLNGLPYNAVIFENNTNPFIQARATATKVGVPGAIFRSALQHFQGLQDVFNEANGFRDLTNTVYTQHLAVAAKSVYFTSMVPRLWIDPFPAHILAFLLFASGFLGVFLQIINRRQRRNLFLAATAWVNRGCSRLTSRSGFGDLLLPYDDITTIEKKLDGLRFRLDKRTGAILADDYEPTADDSFRGPDDAMMSLLGHREPMQSSSQLAQTAALEAATGYPAWKHDSLKTPYDK
ncbi:hypothetical protein C8F04DRAFT_1182944 [Mycena alexandri]|uniref:Uncharacterized protein n=1 Tax=Mycena alexandri TaxID=1745969 RepID=A0AAD6SV86_9AGAR|nr:hypothetical protein C8F04DRAFT_1182944 [Mycena alexandri]